MLTGKMVRVRYARDRIAASYIKAEDPAWQEVAARLIELYRGQEGKTRGELEDDLRDLVGDDPSQLIHQGLAKLLEDRCEFEVVSGQPPDKLRSVVFRRATQHRQAASKTEPVPFDRGVILQQAAGELGLTPEQIDQGLFADLKSEQKLVHFKDISVEHLLQRYNESLAQAILLRSTRVTVIVRGEPPQRYRALLRQIKFHRLLCEVEQLGPDSFQLRLDGPLSLFSATQKYGLQLALFLPAVLLCKDFELKADLLWGPQRKPKTFVVTPKDGLVSHQADRGIYVPPELGMFAELFRKRIEEWELLEETEVYAVGSGFWVPDYRLRHRQTGRQVLLEVLGFWRRSSAEKHLAWLKQNVQEPFLLAVSDQLHIDEAELESLPAGIARFRNMPLPDEVARLATELMESRK
jgi:predicted nuclease of restriction endonuclease-like RecB superfamily